MARGGSGRGSRAALAAGVTTRREVTRRVVVTSRRAATPPRPAMDTRQVRREEDDAFLDAGMARTDDAVAIFIIDRACIFVLLAFFLFSLIRCEER